MTRRASVLAVPFDVLEAPDRSPVDRVTVREKAKRQILADVAEDARADAKRYVTTWEVRGGGE